MFLFILQKEVFFRIRVNFRCSGHPRDRHLVPIIARVRKITRFQVSVWDLAPILNNGSNVRNSEVSARREFDCMTNEKYLDEVFMLNEMTIKAELLMYIFPRPNEIVYGRHYKDEFVREMNHLVHEEARRCCEGCRIDDLSQLHHDCIMKEKTKYGSVTIKMQKGN